MKRLTKLIKVVYNNFLIVLKFLRITDENGVISLTNMALMLMIWKVAQTDAKSIADLAGLFIAILSYQAKRVIENKK